MTRTEQNTLNETWKRNLSNSHLIAPTSSKKETFVKKKNLNEIIDRYATEKFQKKPTNNRIETHSTKNNRVRFAANAFLSPPTRPRDIRNRRVNNPEGGWFSRQKQAPSSGTPWRSTPFENNGHRCIPREKRSSLVKRSLSRCESGQKKRRMFSAQRAALPIQGLTSCGRLENRALGFEAGIRARGGQWGRGENEANKRRKAVEAERDEANEEGTRRRDARERERGWENGAKRAASERTEALWRLTQLLGGGNDRYYT